MKFGSKKEQPPVQTPVIPEILPDVNTEEGRMQFRMMVAHQYAFLDDQCKRLQEQLSDLKDKLADQNDGIVQRIERILALMTTHMACLKQVIELVDNFGDRLAVTEKADMRRDMEYTSIVERQNKFSEALSAFTANSNKIYSELEDLKRRTDDHDKFQFKATLVGTIIMTIIVWLMTGNNFTSLLNNLKELVFSN